MIIARRITRLLSTHDGLCDLLADCHDPKKSQKCRRRLESVFTRIQSLARAKDDHEHVVFWRKVAPMINPGRTPDTVQRDLQVGLTKETVRSMLKDHGLNMDIIDPGWEES